MTAVQFQIGWLVALAIGVSPAHGEAPKIEPRGMLIRECTLPGETRKDDVVPRHATAIQVAAQRWLIVYSTHGYRGVDDERSIVYQLRKDRPDGALIKEGFLERTNNSWRPSDVPAPPEGTSYVKQHGHMVAFGVPRGALIDGRTPPHANIFTIMWRVQARPLAIAENRLDKAPEDSALYLKTRAVEWCQCRLNDKEDDVEILQPVSRLRQKGFETGAAFCSAQNVSWMIQSFCPPVPANSARNEWAVANHFDQHRAAALKFRFNEKTRLYEWVETGPFIGTEKSPCWEASLIHLPTGWALASRSNGKVLWAHSADPFKEWSNPVYSAEPSVNAPLTSFLCADGVVRLFTGDRTASPQKYDRDPLYCWEVKLGPEVTTSGRTVILDSRAAKLPIRDEVRSKVDFCELFPAHDDRTQLLVFGVSTRGYNFPYANRKDIPALEPGDKVATGLYFATLTYPTPVHAMWTFEENKR